MEYKLNELKIMLLNKIKESKISKADRLKLVEYIDNADMVQTKHLLLYGTMTENITPLRERQMEALYESKEVQTKLQELGVIGSTLSSVFGMGLWQTWRFLASQYSDAQKMCGTFKISNDRNACIAKARINFATKRIQLLKQTLPRCDKNSNKEKCQKTIKYQLAKQEAKLEKQREKLDKLVLKGRGYAGEPGQIVTTRS